MSICYVNGKYLLKKDSNVSIEDRGLNFSDSVYEVIAFRKQNLLNYVKHINRLKRSLNELKINSPFSNFKSLEIIIKNLIKFNALNNGFIYLQITRGTSIRNHLFPKFSKPNVIVILYNSKDTDYFKKGVKVITIDDMRWQRCDIKSTSLLANVLGKQTAEDKGAYESIQINKQNYITEGTTSNIFFVHSDNLIQTHPSNNNILGGVTRDIVIELAKRKKFKVLEKPLSIRSLKTIKEAFLTSTTVGVVPVIKIDNLKISECKPGLVSKQLMILFKSNSKKQIKNNL
tara:strand:+ start:666 stop:1526 length:861 start_codon:yes stop_codon:yes gene_type:complete